MADKPQEPTERVHKGFEEALNRHGYSFHYTVLKTASDLFDARKSSWALEATEFPVEVQGNGTRIDFILRRHNRFGIGESHPFYMLAECKRANPAMSTWYFAKAPFVRRNRDYEQLYLEHLYRNRDYQISEAYAQGSSTLKNAFHIALEVKTDKPGDSGGSRGAIEEAATQIMRGMNGFVDFTFKNLQVLGTYSQAYFLPVIFTTAELWSTDADIETADLATGNLDTSKSTFQKQPWLYFQYHQSPGLKHGFPMTRPPETLGEILDVQYIRTIAIVNAHGVANFLDHAGAIELR